MNIYKYMRASTSENNGHTTNVNNSGQELVSVFGVPKIVHLLSIEISTDVTGMVGRESL